MDDNGGPGPKRIAPDLARAIRIVEEVFHTGAAQLAGRIVFERED
jgi:hypothetical protein